MSIRVMTWVFDHSPAQKIDRLVLLFLADKANDDGTGAYPTVETQAKAARCSERSVQYALRALEDAGAIENAGLAPNGSGATNWTVRMDDRARGAKFAPRPTGAKHDAEGVQSTTERGARTAPKPSSNRPENHPAPQPPTGGQDLLPHPPEGSRRRDRAQWEQTALAWAARNGLGPNPDRGTRGRGSFLHLLEHAAVWTDGTPEQVRTLATAPNWAGSASVRQ